MCDREFVKWVLEAVNYPIRLHDTSSIPSTLDMMVSSAGTRFYRNQPDDWPKTPTNIVDLEKKLGGNLGPKPAVCADCYRRGKSDVCSFRKLLMFLVSSHSPLTSAPSSRIT